jgi:Leucine-rich repeat (LRR) protein
MRRFFIVLIFLTGLIVPNNAAGQNSSMNDAAREFWIRHNPNRSNPLTFQFDRITRQEELVVYEKFSPASFIVLMETRSGCFPVAYSFSNLFFGNDPEQTDQQALLKALRIGGGMDQGKFKGSRGLNPVIGPLLHTRWGQGQFFNYACPRDPRGPDGRVYAGCVAVAMGQIIRYYGRFNEIDLQREYMSANYGKLSARIGGYDWSAMEDDPIAVNMEVSDLLADLGVLLQMSYGVSGSTTNSYRALEAFHDIGYFGGLLLRKSKHSSESWTEIFYQNLSEFKPILVTGGGHAFVCDGYNTEGMFHFNLGWNGYGDGYYSLSSVMNMPVNEAFTELEPVSGPRPPQLIEIKSGESGTFLHWSYDSEQSPLLSRIYKDDRLFAEIADTIFDITRLGPGVHLVYVSAVYQDGESRWIGPVEVFVRGDLLKISDPNFLDVVKRNLGKNSPDFGEMILYEGDLSRITSLEIDRPVLNMKDIGLCNHLRRLIIDGFPGPGLDAGPLGNLKQLKILEWNGRIMENQESLMQLSNLSELRLRNTSLESFAFLAGMKNLVKFEYSDAQICDTNVLGSMLTIEVLNLSRTNLSDATFISGMHALTFLELSGNEIFESGFLSPLSNLIQADLSHNKLTRLLLTDQLQSLHKLDVSGNEISIINIAAELKNLKSLDLSDNKLATPGRLFVYTPALIELNLRNNQLRDMGKLRSQSLEILDVSYNQLITTDWISLQPRLKKIELNHNRISDLSGLIRNNLYRQLDYLGLDRNPLSKQSFLEWLPLLVQAIDSVSKPLSHQPLSPCYVTPVGGSCLTGHNLELQWVVDTTTQKCVFDLYVAVGDSLIPLINGLNEMKAVLDHRPSSAFSWVVASRTADSVYFSGVNDVVSSTAFMVPFKDGFETYSIGKPLAVQSDIWSVSTENESTDRGPMIVMESSRVGNNSLELRESESVFLSVEHLKLPYLQIQFSIMIPHGNHGIFRVQNMNGIYLKLIWDETNTGRFYLNDKLFSTFSFEHQKWMDVQVLGHARNNNFHVKVGNQILINVPWMVPEGAICTESIEFLCCSEELSNNQPNSRLFLDEVSISSASVISGLEPEIQLESLISAYPNPSNTLVNVVFGIPGTYTLSMLDNSGKEVYRQLVEVGQNGIHVLSVTDLPSGIYWLKTDSVNFKPIRIVRI